MGKDIKAQSSEALRRKAKTAKVILLLCWSALVIAIVMVWLSGKSLVIPGLVAGFSALLVVTIAMRAGLNRINDELARRND